GSSGCLGTNVTSTIDINVLQAPLRPTGEVNQFFCLSDNPTVGNLSAVGSGINWYDEDMGIVLSSSTPLADAETYYATQTVDGCESGESLMVNAHISNVVLSIISQTTPICNNVNGNVLVEANGGNDPYDYDWSNGATQSLLSPIGEGQYTVTVTDSVGCTDQLSIRLDCNTSGIPQIITPDGNGKNETWVLRLEDKAEVNIYNRWGNLVFSASPYLDNWSGQTNKGLTIGKEYLPGGTYFYVIDYKNGEKPVSGYLELFR
ncbi:MAG: gliding motility-associated C-terminal domain-containing protein, partial [Crocinitomicaceae bacterium]|nr:gliding motility-associated C-terminal domain-containing protein [Crocinitomicaceae bacterium]